METLRLRKIQQPSAVERLLESYISHAAVLPSGAYQVRATAEVPRELRGVLRRAVEHGRSWSCWTHGTRAWLFTCEMSLPLSRERGAPVLQVNLYGDDGALTESASVIKGANGDWTRCAD